MCVILALTAKIGNIPTGFAFSNRLSKDILQVEMEDDAPRL